MHCYDLMSIVYCNEKSATIQLPAFTAHSAWQVSCVLWVFSVIDTNFSVMVIFFFPDFRHYTIFSLRLMRRSYRGLKLRNT